MVVTFTGARIKYFKPKRDNLNFVVNGAKVYKLRLLSQKKNGKKITKPHRQVKTMRQKHNLNCSKIKSKLFCSRVYCNPVFKCMSITIFK